MSARFRITVRGLGIELRGYLDDLGDEDQPGLVELSEAMKPFGLVVASPMERNSDPWDGQPTPEKSYGMIADKLNAAPDAASFVHEMAQIHYGQALVIRGERERADRAEQKLVNARHIIATQGGTNGNVLNLVLEAIGDEH